MNNILVCQHVHIRARADQRVLKSVDGNEDSARKISNKKTQPLRVSSRGARPRLGKVQNAFTQLKSIMQPRATNFFILLQDKEERTHYLSCFAASHLCVGTHVLRREAYAHEEARLQTCSLQPVSPPHAPHVIIKDPIDRTVSCCGAGGKCHQGSDMFISVYTKDIMAGSLSITTCCGKSLSTLSLPWESLVNSKKHEASSTTPTEVQRFMAQKLLLEIWVLRWNTPSMSPLLQLGPVGVRVYGL